MEIELVPDPRDDRVGRAAAAALALEGLTDVARPTASTGAWRRAGLQDAVERSVTPDDSDPTGTRSSIRSGSTD